VVVGPPSTSLLWIISSVPFLTDEELRARLEKYASISAGTSSQWALAGTHFQFKCKTTLGTWTKQCSR